MAGVAFLVLGYPGATWSVAMPPGNRVVFLRQGAELSSLSWILQQPVKRGP